MKKTLEELEINEYEEWTIEKQFTTNELKMAYQQIDKLFVEYKAKIKSSTLVILQSPFSNSEFEHSGLRTMSNEFPIIRFPIFQKDNVYPPIDWIRFAFTNMIVRFTEADPWLKNRIAFSRYSLIPLGNLD